ncbi:CpaE family protein [Paenibacillus sp. 2TAB26]|uniref:AAA family ATPase n=1 Tax=Paenibacillus sp. 2TAB26 TaxID=3233005 RepID=UPI003F9E754C
MKIMFALKNPQLTEAISNIVPSHVEANYSYNETELTKTITRLSQELNFLIVQEDIFYDSHPWEWLGNIKNLVSDKTKIIVILSINTDSLYRELFNRICLELEITLVQGALTNQDIVDEINGRVFNNKRTVDSNIAGRLTTFIAASPKDGATTVAISTSICLAQRLPGQKVLLLDLNLKSPEVRDHLLITTDKGYPLIQADCDSGTLEQNTLLKACDQIKGIENLYILTGLQRREYAEKISVDEIEHLLTVAKATFDYVIADVHTFPDQAATVKCVKNADDRVVVVQSVITSYQSTWNDWFNSVWQHYGLKESDFHLALNRDLNAAMDGFQIEKSMGSKIVSRISNVEKGAGIKAINYGTPLYLNEDTETNEFRTNILTLSGWLANRANLELTAVENDKKSALHGKRVGFLRRLMP